ncbi:MAG: hypothetical protein ABR498_09780 [Candidatus Dormibacteria bacterium]
MPQVVMASQDDEIADLVNLVRTANDSDVGLVLPPGSTALQTPLNARLLGQFSRQNGRRTSIVSADQRVQELARANGLSVYASIPAYERGIEAIGGAAVTTATNGAPAPAVAAAAAAGALGPPAAAATGAAAPRPAPAGPQAGAAGAAVAAKPAGSRRRWYIAAAAVGVVGLLLFFILAPSATVTVTLQGIPLTVNPTIQGSTDAAQAAMGDHIMTSVVDGTVTSQFTATPSGQQTTPAKSATGNVVISYSGPNGTQGTIPQGTAFQTSDHSMTFVATQSTAICIPSSGTSSCFGQPPNNTVPVQDQMPDQMAGAKGNVAANTVTYWPSDPCNPANNPNQTDEPECIDSSHHAHDYYSVTNPQAMSGGADQSQHTVASEQDVSNWNSQVSQIENTLTNQLNAQLQSKASGKQFAVDPGGGGKSLKFDVSPAIPNANQQFSTAQITVTGTGKAAVYSQNDVNNDLTSDLKAQVSQGDQLGPGSFKAQPCQTTQAGVDGTVILSCTATAFSQPIIDLEGLKKQLSGKNPGDANKIIQSKVDKVQNVDVSMFPFRLFYLPFFSSRISIVETFTGT